MYRKSGDGYAKPIDGIEFKTIVHGANTLMAEFRLSAGAVLPLHSHPHEQTGYLVTGHIWLTVGSESFEIYPGDAWCIPGDVEHRADILKDSVAIEVFSPVRDEYLPAT